MARRRPTTSLVGLRFRRDPRFRPAPEIPRGCCGHRSPRQRLRSGGLQTAPRAVANGAGIAYPAGNRIASGGGRRNCRAFSMARSRSDPIAWIDARGLGVRSACGLPRGHGIGLSDGADFGARAGAAQFRLPAAETALADWRRMLRGERLRHPPSSPLLVAPGQSLAACVVRRGPPPGGPSPWLPSSPGTWLFAPNSPPRESICARPYSALALNRQQSSTCGVETRSKRPASGRSSRGVDRNQRTDGPPGFSKPEPFAGDAD